MEIKAYMKKGFLYSYFIISIVLLTVSIILQNLTLILSLSVITLLAITMLIVYLRRPVLYIDKEKIYFHTLFSKTEYYYNDMDNLKYTNEKQNKIEFTYQDNKYITTIQNSYTVSIQEIMDAIKQNKQGE